jgi:hypothetical protein
MPRLQSLRHPRGPFPSTYDPRQLNRSGCALTALEADGALRISRQGIGLATIFRLLPNG